MTTGWTRAGFAGAVAALAVLVAALGFAGTGLAQEATPETRGDRFANATVAIAIGQLTENDGEEATVDLRAIDVGRRVRGSFRFYSEEHGYYNGGVRSLTCDDGVITAKGGGKLTQPDGTRINVVYEATFDASDGSSVITVKSKDGFEYTMEGTLDGLIKCTVPSDLPA